MKGFGFSTMVFTENQAIDAFTQEDDYGIGTKKLCLGVVMQQNNINNRYQYLLRYNESNVPNSQDIPNPNGDRIDQIGQ
jgi:hypothetical protein